MQWHVITSFTRFKQGTIIFTLYIFLFKWNQQSLQVVFSVDCKLWAYTSSQKACWHYKCSLIRLESGKTRSNQFGMLPSNCGIWQVSNLVPISLWASLPVTANSYWYLQEGEDYHVLQLIHMELPAASSHPTVGSFTRRAAWSFLPFQILLLSSEPTNSSHCHNYKDKIPCHLHTGILPVVFIETPAQRKGSVSCYATWVPH